MFATQQYLDAVNSGRKRIRDDEDSVNAATGFGEHRNKRLQSLPLRNSTRAPQQSLPHAIVPLNASPAEAGPRHTIDAWASNFMNNSSCQSDAEMDMTDTIQSTTSGHDGSAAFSSTQQDRSTGRMPTPIHPSFAAQVRGQNGGWAPAQVNTGPNGVVNLGHRFNGFSQNECVPRAINGDAGWHVLQNNRRLPSPISEVGDSGMNDQPCASSGMMMDNEGCVDAQSQFPTQSQCSSSCQPSPTHAMEHPYAMIDADNHLALAQHPDSDADPSSPSPGRKGHQRSKHTVNSWTWQPGMKKSFSIGYRTDCEKCRLKVPGHFNHIVIT
ncbi:hypothetical protein C2857_005572 [Epichloe festucae Fl1]|uniref:Uncharacterized protein n=1 Tax=Epichloe festucae (strain Fl1) TaxID=877507 RepID=A0A7S9PSE0_EPIFF|nr:hypothetical protein C2857_005572 [Epichloe festucae Fl1]